MQIAQHIYRSILIGRQHLRKVVVVEDGSRTLRSTIKYYFSEASIVSTNHYLTNRFVEATTSDNDAKLIIKSLESEDLHI